MFDMSPTEVIVRIFHIFNNVKVNFGFIQVTLFQYLLVPTALLLLVCFFKLGKSGITFGTSYLYSEHLDSLKSEQADSVKFQKAGTGLDKDLSKDLGHEDYSDKSYYIPHDY